jgi:Trk K+ transport system NAD-binding subunit
METRVSPWRRKGSAAARDTWLLLRQSRAALVAFLVAVVGGGIAYFALGRMAGEPPPSLVAAIYHSLSLIFLQSALDFPSTWYLQAFYFVMPLVGLAILAQGLAEFGVSFFNRQARRKEWEMALASTYADHVVLIGLGHLGLRVLDLLTEFGQDVVVIESDPALPAVETVRQLGAPVLIGDASRDETLLQAGVDRARSVISCTRDDTLSMKIGVRVHRLNPQAEVILRIFDDELAQALEGHFGFRALSGTKLAAPAFAALAARLDITQPLVVEGEPLSLGSFTLGPGSKLIGHSIGAIEEANAISVVFLRRGAERMLHPAGEAVLQAADTVGMLGRPDQLAAMAAAARAG